jgi:taurine dioxygenase
MNKLVADISNIDLLSSNPEELQFLLDTYGVLVFRNQPLDVPDLIKVGEKFGELMNRQTKQFALKDYPMVSYNSTHDLPLRDGKLQVRGEGYHTDHSNWACPPKASALSAVKIPSIGGDTQFVDCVQAYEDLDEITKNQIGSLYARHVYNGRKSAYAMVEPDATDTIPEAIHPLVIKHPVLLKPVLYLNIDRMSGIEGMDINESFQLIDKLYAHATQTKYEYRHRWQEGDFVIWDNRKVMHQANADYDPAEFRYLYKIMIKGDKLVQFVSTNS